MITVLDLGISNIGSVIRALEFLKIQNRVVQSAQELLAAEKIILPGVGSFKAGVEAIENQQLKDVLRKKALEQKIPFLGVCLGMQLMFSDGVEGGTYQGLGLFKGKILPINVDRKRYPVPHMGWNQVESCGLKMFNNITDQSCFYFVHSYGAEVCDPEAKYAFTEYGGTNIVAAVEKDNIWGAQFHAERSQRLGLEILKNFQGLTCCARE